MRLTSLSKQGSKSRTIEDLLVHSRCYGQHAYAITISNNLAKVREYISEYNTIASQLPVGSFIYVIELSSKGKYHLHGILLTSCAVSYQNIQTAREAEKLMNEYDQLTQTYFGSFVRYDLLKTPLDLRKWVYYLAKDPLEYHLKEILQK